MHTKNGIKKKNLFESSTRHDLSFIRMKDNLQVEAGTYSRLDLDTRELESKRTLHREGKKNKEHKFKKKTICGVRLESCLKRKQSL